MKHLRAALASTLAGAILATFVGAPSAAHAAEVAMTGQMGRKALLVIDGKPRALAVGESAAGVQVLGVTPQSAELMIEGRRRRVHLGEAPVNLGGVASVASGRRIVMPVGPGGHFISSGSIDGGAVQFMVDTGASVVALSRADADRLGLKYKEGQPVQVGTANGSARGHLVMLKRLRIQDVELANVEALVTPQPMPFVLLGNSYLSRFDMTRSGDRLTLDRRF